MSGNENKVVINLSSECLKKMANDPEFAKKVEFNLTGAVPGQNRMFAQAKADNAVIHGVTSSRASPMRNLQKFLWKRQKICRKDRQLAVLLAACFFIFSKNMAYKID